MKKDDGFANLPDDLLNSVPFEVIYHPLTDKHEKPQFNTIRFQKLEQEQQRWNEFLFNHISAIGIKAGQGATAVAQTGGNMLVRGIGGLFKYVANSIFSSKAQTNQEVQNQKLEPPTIEEKDESEDIPIIILMPQHIIESNIAEQQKWIEQYSDQYQIYVPKQIKQLETLKRNDSNSDGSDSKPQFDYDYVDNSIRQDNWNIFDSRSKSISVMPEEEFRQYQENILQIQQIKQEEDQQIEKEEQEQKLVQKQQQEVLQQKPLDTQNKYPQFQYPSLVNKPIFVARPQILDQSVSFITVPKIVKPQINAQNQQNQQTYFPNQLPTEFVPLPEPIQQNKEVQQYVPKQVQQVEQEYEEMLVE
ncbi:hypothetical protein pb186bvf_013364 [Paramecium bursaria]